VCGWGARVRCSSVSLPRASRIGVVLALSAATAVTAGTPDVAGAAGRSVTSVRIATGRGDYATFPNGHLQPPGEMEFTNAGVDLSHRFSFPVRVGARFGRFQLEDGVSARYSNPYVSIDWSGLSLGGGWVAADHALPQGGEEDLSKYQYTTASGHIRIGSKVYWSVSYLEDLPIAAGGYAQTGIGIRRPGVHLWFGAGAVPQDQPGFVAKMDLPLTRGFSLLTATRLGHEGSFSIGLSYDWVHAGKAGSASPAARDSTRAP